MEENQNVEQSGTGKKVGYFFLAIVPAIACVILQFLAALPVIIVAVVIAIASGVISPAEMTPNSSAYMDFLQSVSPYAVGAYHIVGLFVFGLWYKLSFKKPRPTVKQSFGKLTIPVVVAAILSGIILCFFSNGTIVVENNLFPSLVEKFEQMSETAGFGTNYFAMFAAVCLAPIGEEFICRGLSLKYGKKAFGNFWIANILQAFLFGCIHANVVQGIYAFVLGLFMGYIVEKSGTIVSGMIFHLAVNFSATFWIGKVLDAIFPEFDSLGLGVGLVLVVLPLIISGALVYFLIGKKAQENTVAA